MSSTPSPNPEDLRRYYGLVIGNQKQLRDLYVLDPPFLFGLRRNTHLVLVLMMISRSASNGPNGHTVPAFAKAPRPKSRCLSS